MRGHQQGQHLADFDPATHPIIARHFFGIEPPCLNTLVPAEMVADLRFRRQVEHLHSLGARAVTEALAQVGAKHGIQTSIEQTVGEFAELDPEALEAAGGDEFWPTPLHEVRRVS